MYITLNDRDPGVSYFNYTYIDNNEPCSGADEYCDTSHEVRKCPTGCWAPPFCKLD